MTLKATLRTSQKEHGENKFFHSSPGGTSSMFQCVLLCCVVVLYCAVLLCCVALRSVPATEGFSDRCEKAVRDAFTLTDTCWEQCMLGDVKWGREKNHKNA